MKSRIKQPN